VARYSNESSSIEAPGRRRGDHEVDAVGRDVLADHRRSGPQPEHVGGAHSAELAVVGGEAAVALAPGADTAARTSRYAASKARQTFTSRWWRLAG
jgi:hypothetical protein